MASHIIQFESQIQTPINANVSFVEISPTGNTVFLGDIPNAYGYVFYRASNFTDFQRIRAYDATVRSYGFGTAAAFSHDDSVLTVGGSGSAPVGGVWVFTKNTTTQQYIQFQPQMIISGNIGGSGVGLTIACDYNCTTIISGGYNDNNGIGSVFVFGLTNGTYQQVAKLVPMTYSKITLGSNMVLMSFDANLVIASSFLAVWIFENLGDGTWSQTSIENPTIDSFAMSIAYSSISKTLFVGAQSSIYVYKRSLANNDNWEEVSENPSCSGLFSADDKGDVLIFSGCSESQVYSYFEPIDVLLPMVTLPGYPITASSDAQGTHFLTTSSANPAIAATIYSLNTTTFHYYVPAAQVVDAIGAIFGFIIVLALGIAFYSFSNRNVEVQRSKSSKVPLAVVVDFHQEVSDVAEARVAGAGV